MALAVEGLVLLADLVRGGIGECSWCGTDVTCLSTGMTASASAPDAIVLNFIGYA